MNSKSLSHTKWKCQYHIVFIPKYRKKKLFGQLRLNVREILNIDCEIIVSEPGWKPEYSRNNERLLSEMGEFQFTAYKDAIKSLGDFYRENINLIDETLFL